MTGTGKFVAFYNAEPAVGKAAGLAIPGKILPGQTG
jgi:hypothetical protein